MSYFLRRVRAIYLTVKKIYDDQVIFISSVLKVREYSAVSLPQHSQQLFSSNFNRIAATEDETHILLATWTSTKLPTA